MFLFGVVLAILGTLFGLPAMRESLGIDFAQQGDVLFALMFGVFVATVISGPAIDRFGNKIVLTASATVVASMLALFAAVGSFPAAVVVAALLGFGGAGLNTAANALVADIYPEERGARLSVVAAFYGVGAIVMPMLAAPGIFSIRGLLLVAASLAAACAIGYALLAFPAPRVGDGFSFFASLRVAAMPGVAIVGVILLCESGNESSIAGWTSTYVASIGASSRAATWVLAGHWAALIAGRVLAPRLMRVMSHTRIVLMSAIGSIVGCALLAAAHSVSVAAAGAALAGISFAAVYPAMLATIADRYERDAAIIFGFLFAAGLVGGMCFPFAIGHVAQRWGVRNGMLLPIAGAVAIAVLVLVIRYRLPEKNREGETS